VRADEIHPGPERDRRKLRLRAGAYDSVHRFVERTVATDRDDECRAVARRALGEFDRVAGPLGEERLAA
jgi:hypothetical protein